MRLRQSDEWRKCKLRVRKLWEKLVYMVIKVVTINMAELLTPLLCYVKSEEASWLWGHCNYVLAYLTQMLLPRTTDIKCLQFVCLPAGVRQSLHNFLHIRTLNQIKLTYVSKASLRHTVGMEMLRGIFSVSVRWMASLKIRPIENFRLPEGRLLSEPWFFILSVSWIFPRIKWR
jgi:hypothetical protein